MPTFFSKDTSLVAAESYALHTTWNGLTDRANTFKQVGKFPLKRDGWRDAPLAFCNLAKAFKHNTICDSNGIQTHNHLVRKRTLVNDFTKLVK